MNSSTKTRAALAVIVVMLPFAVLYLYQSTLRHALDLPSAWDLLSRPLVTLAENPEVPVGKTLTPPAVLTSANIASGKQITGSVSEQHIDDNEPPTEARENPFQLADTVGDIEVTQNSPVEISPMETVKSFEKPIQNESGNEFHAGITQEGQLIPGLTLEMGEKEIKHLLRNDQAFLVVTVAEQRYLLTVTNQQNPFRNVNVGHLENQQKLSERYITLPRAKLKRKDLDKLDNKVAERTGFLAKPRYSLVFSKEFNRRLTNAQLARVEEEGVDLAAMRARGIPVSMDGNLVLMNGRIDFSFSF